jgi:hypothetical protein
MNKFNIEVISTKPEIIDGLLSYWGRIIIENFSEKFVMPVTDWSLDEYKQQWENALKRINTYNFSCLVVTVQNLKDNPLIETWNIYKEEKKIYFQNSLLIEETVEHKKVPIFKFNATNCYQFIDYPREQFTEEGEKISEWSMNADDFFSSIKMIKK